VFGRHEHAEDDRLVPVLRTQLARPAHDAGEGAVDECAIDGVAAVGGETLCAVLEGLDRFLIVARRERVRVLGESAQAQRPIQGGVARREPSNRDLR
jgi:hypothetical protein